MELLVKAARLPTLDPAKSLAAVAVVGEGVRRVRSASSSIRQSADPLVRMVLVIGIPANSYTLERKKQKPLKK